MAKQPKSKSPSAPSAEGSPILQMGDFRLQKIKQSKEVWQCGVKTLEIPVHEEGEVLHPQIIFVAEPDEGMLGMGVVPMGLSANDLWDALSNAMQDDKSGPPRRPAQILTIADPMWDELKPRLAGLGISIKHVPDLPLVDLFYSEFIEQVQGDLDGDGPACLDCFDFLDTPGTTPGMIASFYQAAFDFYQFKPWLKIDDSSIRVECPSFPVKGWDAVIMGQANTAFGLSMHPGTTLRQALAQMTDDDEANAMEMTSSTVTFETEDELPDDYVNAAKKHKWKRPSKTAHPVIMCKDRGTLNPRLPLIWEIDLLEAAMRAIPTFIGQLNRKRGQLQIDNINPVITVDVKTGSGQTHQLTLSWAVY